jgi:S-adenosylmethionine decarboxylase
MTHNHLLCDFWFSEEACGLLKYVDPLQAILTGAAEAGGAHVCHAHFRQFLPWGVTGFLLLEESHISLHTWVEERYAALDVFSCGTVDNDAILQYLTDRLRPQRVDILGAGRGCPGDVYGATTISRRYG